jgi:hypothetical protein
VSPELENSFCEICQQKMLHTQGQENDFSRAQMSLNSQSLPSDKLQIQVQSVREIVILNVRLTLRYHFLHPVKMKNDLGPEVKVMFQGFRLQWKINSFLSTQPKIRLVEVQKAMFRVTAYPLHLIFYFLTIRKRDFRETEKDFQTVF